MDILSAYFLILASIDRLLITSPEARTRRRSTVRFALICILSGILFWAVFHCHALFTTNIIRLGVNVVSCYFESTASVVFLGFYSLIVRSLLVPLVMSACALRTIFNIRSAHRARVVPAGLSRTHMKDRQLALMLLVEVCVHLVCSLMLSIVVMYQQITQYDTKTPGQLQIELFLQYIGVFVAFAPSCIDGFINAWASKAFRKELKQILQCLSIILRSTNPI